MIIIKKILILLLFILLNNATALENKIILKVDNDIITSLDIVNEINNLKFFNNKLNQLDQEDVYNIALDSILKFKIKKSEIIKILGEIKLDNDDYLNSLIQNEYRKLGFESLEAFKEKLTNNKLNYKTYKEKIKIEIIWNQIIYSKYSNKVKINEQEIRKKIQNRSKLIDGFKLSEIVFESNNLKDLDKNYKIIVNDISALGFENAALKYSISNTANNGGNLGWLKETQINKEILKELKKIADGSITKPIRTPSGFLILKKISSKKIERELDFEKEFKKQINYQTNLQLNNYSNLYFNKVKKNLDINAP